MTVKPDEVLFIGVEGTPQTWYRCALPARALGADWAGITNDFRICCGETRGGQQPPNLEDYKVVVAQYAAGETWNQRIAWMKSEGIKVVYEIDDYLHGIKDVPEHVHHQYFKRGILRQLEQCMGQADALIVTTKFLAERYRKLCPGPTFVCQNGVDLPRFDVHRPPRDHLTVGWSGATGHVGPMLEWLNGGMGEVLRAREDVRFSCVGAEEVGKAIAEVIGKDRVDWTPFSAFETYPSSMIDADILLAPAGNGTWHRGKSDLRWLEASALGLPCICDSRAYPDADLQAAFPKHAAKILEELLDDREYAASVGADAYEQISTTGRVFPRAADQWREPLGLS